MFVISLVDVILINATKDTITCLLTKVLKSMSWKGGRAIQGCCFRQDSVDETEAMNPGILT